MEFKSQACSKLILAGEHLVLHGYDGLAIPNFEHLTTIFLQQSVNPKIVFNQKELKADSLEYKIFIQDLDFYTELLKFSESQKKNLSQFSITVDLPHIGIGLGASASFAVAMIKLLAEFKNLKLNQTELLKFASMAEKKYHGNSSGIDHTTIVHQKPILLNGKSKQFTILDFKLPNFWQKITLHNTGKPKESTKQMVEYVSSKISNFSKTELANLNQQLPFLINSLTTNNLSVFIKVINQYGQFLEQIPICTNQIISQNQSIRQKQGAAKICGAGGLTNGSGICLRYEP